MSAKRIALFVLLGLLLIVAIPITRPAFLNSLFWHISTSSALSILLSFIIGLLAGCYLMMIAMMKKISHGLDYSFFNWFQILLARYYERVLMGGDNSSIGE